MSDFIINNGILEKYTGGDSIVNIPDGVTAIGREAFFSLKQINAVTIPDSVTLIGVNAFSCCENLAQITFPNQLSVIERSAFLFCKQLSAVHLPDSLTSIDSKAFEGCESLMEISIPEGIREIKDKTFNSCSQLKKVTLPDNLERIGYAAFYGTAIENITLPGKLTTIDEFAFSKTRFQNKPQIQQVMIPPTVKNIGIAAFGGAKEIHVYDTIDPNAPSEINHFKEMNGLPHSAVGWIGVKQLEGYVTDIANADWKMHTIVVHSAETGKVKYEVCIPEKGQCPKAQRGFLSLWGPNAEFYWSAMDTYFSLMNTYVKTVYAIDRIRYPIDLGKYKREEFIEHLNKNSTKAVAMLLDGGDFELLEEYSTLLKKADIEELMKCFSSDPENIQIKMYLMDYAHKNGINLNAKEELKQKRIEAVWTTSMELAGHEGIKGLKFAADANTLRTFYGKWELKRYLEENGATLGSTINEKVHYYIEGIEPTSKKNQALDLGISIISEDEFNRMASRDPESEHKKIDKNSEEYMDWAWTIKTDSLDETYIVSYHGDDETLDFPVRYKNKRITRISSGFAKRSRMDTVKRIVIPEGYTEIESSAFEGCRFESIRLPISLRKLGEKVFMGCTFEEIIIPPYVNQLNHWLFRDCKNLKTVYIMANSGSIVRDGNIFRGCPRNFTIYTTEGSNWDLRGKISQTISIEERYRVLNAFRIKK